MALWSAGSADSGSYPAVSESLAEKADWKTAVGYVAQNRQPDEPLILLIDDFSVAAYYNRRFDLQPVIDLRHQPIDLDKQDAPSIWVMMNLHAPITWDVMLALDQERHIGRRDAISDVDGIDNTIFYRFDSGDTDDLDFQFGHEFAFTGDTGAVEVVRSGEEVCFGLPLRTLTAIQGQYSAGLHLLDQDRRLVAQSDAGLRYPCGGGGYPFDPLSHGGTRNLCSDPRDL